MFGVYPLKVFSFLFLLLLIISGCSNDPIPAKILPPPTDVPSTLLLFKKEKKIEIWSNLPEKQLLSSDTSHFEIETIAIGQYLLEKNKRSEIDQLISNWSDFKIQELLVFPNDPRTASGLLEPCFACPHFQAETYAKLEIRLKDYPFDK